MKPPGIILAPGDTGQLVHQLQRQLLSRSISGTFDEPTQARLRGWQLTRGLDPTGVVDTETAKELGWI